MVERFKVDSQSHLQAERSRLKVGPRTFLTQHDCVGFDCFLSANGADLFASFGFDGHMTMVADVSVSDAGLDERLSVAVDPGQANSSCWASWIESLPDWAFLSVVRLCDPWVVINLIFPTDGKAEPRMKRTPLSFSSRSTHRHFKN